MNAGEQADPASSNIPVGRLAIGLTGGIGSGKTRVADAFAERGASIVDTDKIAHQLTAPGGRAIPAIVTHFGNDMIAPSGAMDRPKMRQLVFTDPQQKLLLESILHPMIREEVTNQAALATGPYVIYVVPLLTESGKWKFPRVLVVDCDENHQIQRVMRRDGLPENLIRAILTQQATRQQRLALATDVLVNDSAFETLLPQIDRLHKIYCDLSSSNQTEYL